MEDNIYTPVRVDFVKTNPGVIDTDSWYRSWKGEIQNKIAGLYRLLFGYQKDPGRKGVDRILTPLTVQLVTRKPTPRKTFEQ